MGGVGLEGAPPRELPAANPAAYVAQLVTAARARYTFHAAVPADAATVRARTYPLPSRVLPHGDHTSTLDLAAANPHHIAQQLLGIDLDPDPEGLVQETPELAPRLEQLGRRLLLRRPCADRILGICRSRGEQVARAGRRRRCRSVTDAYGRGRAARITWAQAPR
ncbi:hypothetical protein [Streptomyces decoyicus]|uniref:hypothetical protein n=1 Tax=Streptomyces decoyicus TaxID=249567 RepID=UPI0004AA877E|nr:hypothetical protein [Streptomyces decoyicus]KOG41220.1 hypothetical protein ADK74_21995 [Streptomyces decoyicus]QZY20125.1 hypothetical protein K7C20_37015 [Streptomyces decoyicus]